MKTNIALIGFMGTGKTQVGRTLARKLNKEFVELDDLIVQRAGKSINTVFEDDGEIAFRELEIAVTKEAAGGKYRVIACGGGIVLNKINIDRLKQNSRVVYLKAAPQVILKRVAGNEERPLLKTPDRLRQIKELLSYRKPFYERVADITINTSRLDVAAVSEQIIDRLKEDECFSF